MTSQQDNRKKEHCDQRLSKKRSTPGVRNHTVVFLSETGRFASIPLADAAVFLDSRTNYALFIAGSAISGTLTLIEVALEGSDDVTER
jgi:hypothetical protein